MRETLTPGAGFGDFDRRDPVDPSVVESPAVEEAGCVLFNQAATAGKLGEQHKPETQARKSNAMHRALVSLVAHQVVLLMHR